MSDTVKVIHYYYAKVGNKPGEGRRLLEHLSEREINLLAFTAFPLDPDQSQLDFVTERSEELQSAADDANMVLVGPKKAFLIQGEDRVGALHEHHLKLANAGINVHAANGVCDGSGRFGFVLWVKPDDFDKAEKTLTA